MHPALKILRVCAALLSCVVGCVHAAEAFRLSSRTDSVIGGMTSARADARDTLLDVARRHGLGYHEIKLVNPGLDTWMPGTDAEIMLPTEFVLPSARRDGLVLNIPEMRIYYFREGAEGGLEVMTFPVGIGREGWDTPYVNTRIIQKQKEPNWFPPESIREEHAAIGDPLPKRVGPGPDNPLGDYAMRLGLPQYLIHGTNKPWGIGMRVSHGCIRLYPEDIEELFGHVPLGTPVRIVNQPYKVGQLGDRLYLEAHPYLDEDAEQFQDNLTSVVKMIVALTADRPYQVDWDLAKQIIRQARGIPVEIGRLENLSPDGKVAPDADPAVADERGISLRLETSLSEAQE